MYKDPDQELHVVNRKLRTYPSRSLVGSTGRRLWADCIVSVPGFEGTIDFIHKINLPRLFTVTCDQADVYEPSVSDWHPSYNEFHFRSSRFSVDEIKFITWNDCAVSFQQWTNSGSRPLTLTLNGPEGAVLAEPSVMKFTVPVTEYGFEIAAAVTFSHPELADGLVLGPGESVCVRAACALGIAGESSEEDLVSIARHYSCGSESPEELLSAQRKEYASFFEQLPSFTSNDPLLDKTWLYRWFILRHNLTDPRWGNIRHFAFYEGRSHKMTKAPRKPTGWEFTKIIPLSVPLHLTDLRWAGDPTYGRESLLNLRDNQADNGVFPCIFTDHTTPQENSYANYTGWAAYRFYLVHPDKAFFADILPMLKKQIAGERRLHGNGADELFIEYKHAMTGKEYQPSYWYFHGFPDNCKDPATYTPLKRVDRSIYYYLNLLGTAALCRELGDSDADMFASLAERVREDVLNKMWDEQTHFFYDLHYQTDEKAFVKNIVGFYPYWAGITGPEHREGLDYLFREDAFATEFPYPSVSVDCPVFQAEGSWKRNFFKGRNGCMWDGPTWPYTDSIVLDALASVSKENGHRYDAEFAKAFRSYSLLHYTGGDLSKPYLVEHYNSVTGEPISDEPDYNHSFYIDLVIRHIAGLDVTPTSLVLDPVHMGLACFCLDHLSVRGHSVRITYRESGTEDASGIPEGYRLYVDGNEVFSAPELTRTEYPLP